MSPRTGRSPRVTRDRSAARVSDTPVSAARGHSPAGGVPTGQRSARHPAGRRRYRRLGRHLLVRWVAVLLAAVVTTTAVVAAVVSGSANTPAVRGPVEAPDPEARVRATARPATTSPERAREERPLETESVRVGGADSAGAGTAQPFVAEVGSGTFRVAPGPGRAAAPVRGPQATAGSSPLARNNHRLTYRAEVETTLPWLPRRFAAVVDEVLTHRDGWGADRRYALERVGPDVPSQLRVLLATPATADALCAPLQTGRRLSCRNGERVVINAWRWVHGAASYAGKLAAYRRYVVNHEVGHALGNAHASCRRPGALAPVMMQQTKGLDGCRPNPWPGLADLR